MSKEAAKEFVKLVLKEDELARRHTRKWTAGLTTP